MQIFDSLALDASGLAFTREGFLTGDAKVARAGNVQHYLGRELGLKDDDASRVFGVYRDPETVFDEDSMRSLVGRPVTRGHPPKGVTADNWKELTVGQVGGRVVRDGEHVVAPMAIMDAASAKEVAAGARSLSAGYSVEIVADEGIAPDGTAYQFRQASPLRFNHVAYLPDNNPRAGNTRIGDSNWGPTPLTQYELALVDRARGQQHQHGDDHNPSTRNHPMSDKTILVDGLSVVTNDAGAQAIGKLQQQLKDAQTAAGTAEAAHQAAITAKDAAIAKAEGERDALKAQVLSDADLDKRVQQRGDLVAKAKAVHDTDYSGKTDAQVRQAAVVAKLGDAAVAGKHEAYVEALFDGLYTNAKPQDPVVQAMRDSRAQPTQVKDNGYAASVAGLDYRTANQKEA